MDHARQRVTELTRMIRHGLGDSLVALYLHGSLPLGGFCEGRSDIDLLAVVASEITDADLPQLAAIHSEFVSAHPAWDDRLEVAYVSQPVLMTFSGRPAGRIAVIGPGEPLGIQDAGLDWVLNWDNVANRGETLHGPSPLEIGQTVSPEAFRRALEAKLAHWREEVRHRWIDQSLAYQGYIVLAVCRALYGLDTGEATTKEGAAEWAAARFPEWASFIRDALAWHRADRSEPHATTIRFVDFASLLAKPSN